VVDNYGDIGIAWRLARQLAAEHLLDVHLYLDAPAALAHIAPEVDAGVARQRMLGVDVRAWDRARDAQAPDDDIGQVVVEAFGCGLPSGYLAAMCARKPPPVWINLEYLSAEGWIDGYHSLPSPQAQWPLTRHFYFPGFTAQSGGLLREHGLLDRRDAFRADPGARASFWQSLNIGPPPAEALVVSLFCYADAPVAELLDAWAAGDRAVCCMIPDGVASAAVDRWASHGVKPGESKRRGALSLLAIPFVAQDEYDRLLWSCDLNFVRGEDSFVRAQWAARPLIWQPYRQTEGAHAGKLNAFLARYSAGQSQDAATAIAAFSGGWSMGAVTPAQWRALVDTYPALSARADAWATALAAQEDLAARLVKFAADRV
jgi:uncharacterized repeat protein (TIGR03837 family)